MARYAVQLATRYDGLVLATFPDLPGVSGLGRDDEEALAEAQRELAAALAALAAGGEAPPEALARGAMTIEADAPALALPLAAV
jgi:predicted RNase H-like HicB family nuclease